MSVGYGRCPPGHKTTDVHLLAFNDLHGNLEAAGQNIYGQFAGGAAYLAKAVKDRQAQYGDYQATVFAGDNIGASPLANGLFHEEPITVATNLMNVDFASVGNHEFDKGSAELLRIQNGGCHPVEGCTGGAVRACRRRDDERLSRAPTSSTCRRTSSSTRPEDVVPGVRHQAVHARQTASKFKVGFIGEVLKETPTIVTPTGVAGLTFQDEADAANRAVAELESKGVKMPGARRPPGRFPEPARRPQRLRGQPRRQHDRRHRRAGSTRRSR